jgi:hypothetical protein
MTQGIFAGYGIATMEWSAQTGTELRTNARYRLTHGIFPAGMEVAEAVNKGMVRLAVN